MKRKTETNKWNDAWYLALSPNAKLLLTYIYDNCDEAGFIDVIFDKWIYETKLPTRPAINEAIIELQTVLLSNKAEKKLWLTIFLRQEERLPLSVKIDADKYIIEKLLRNYPKFGNHAKIEEILAATKTQRVSKNAGKKAETKTIPPPLPEFKDYFKQHGFPEALAITVWHGYNAANWHDSEGKPIINWKQKCQHVWFKEKNKNNGAKTNQQSDKGRHTEHSKF